MLLTQFYNERLCAAIDTYQDVFNHQTAFLVQRVVVEVVEAEDEELVCLPQQVRPRLADQTQPTQHCNTEQIKPITRTASHRPLPTPSV